MLPDESTARSDYLRILDESAEDYYLYPQASSFFIRVPSKRRVCCGVHPENQCSLLTLNALQKLTERGTLEDVFNRASSGRK